MSLKKRVRAGRITFSGIRSLLATDVDHEGAYAVGDTGTENGLSAAMKFTLRSVIKIAGEVSGRNSGVRGPGQNHPSGGGVAEVWRAESERGGA